MICPACQRPICAGDLAVPVIRVDIDGEPSTGTLDFAHQLCPSGENLEEPASWRSY